MRKLYSTLIVFVLLAVVLIGSVQGAPKVTILRYGHMHTVTSASGQQAAYFATLVEKYTKGAVRVQVYPTSQLGTLQQITDLVSSGTVAMCHNTMAAIGSLYDEFGALDTPYLYRDVKHLMKVTAPTSPIMQRFNEALIKNRGVRVLYSYYFGTRELTCNKAIYTPEDLKGLKIRAIPFPIYSATVEGMGATAVPLDWSETTAALATGTANGQENPVDTIFSAKLWEVQKYLMLTGHIMGAEAVIINEKVWQGFPKDIQKAIQRAATEASKKGTDLTLQDEASELSQLKQHGMTVIGPKDGLKVDAFKKKVTDLINARFGAKYGKLYQEIKAMK